MGLLDRLRVPLSWLGVIRRTSQRTLQDNCRGLAAELAFFFFLALFPALLFFVALASFSPIDQLAAHALGALSRFAPPDVLSLIRDQRGPNVQQRLIWIVPGSVFATVVWLLVSIGFKWYVSAFADYQKTYGAIGGVIVALLWFYVSGLAILMGAEMNAVIEHASPMGKAPGEKVPGGGTG